MSKAPKRSAGILMYRRRRGTVEVFLVHPGGPYSLKKNEGARAIPKGEYEANEEPRAAAIREFQEETGFEVSEPLLELGSIQQKSGKVFLAWAFEGDCDPAELVSNTCEIEWPPRSGARIVIPEVDRGEWFSLQTAVNFIRMEQASLLRALRLRIAVLD
jgi:predicted NUDIX family NTP pyrophosphohydrolase